MCYLRNLYLVVHSDVQHILCCVLSVLALCLLCPMLPVSLACSFLIFLSVFSNVYLHLPNTNEVLGIGK